MPTLLSSPGVIIFLVKTTVILLAAFSITRVMQRSSAGARHLVWLVALGALLLVPALTAWSPLRLAILPATPAAVTSGSTPARGAGATDAAVAASAAPVGDARTDAPLAAPASRPAAASLSSPFGDLATPNWPAMLLALWALVALGIIVALAWAALAVRRIVRRAQPLATPAWRNPLFEIADRFGLDKAPRLLKSDDVKMPFACGVLAPTIVLPAECESWTLERRRAVLLHELAHVRRHDLLGHTIGRITCAAYWFHPLVWTAARALRNESERACDDLALACGTDAPDYAEHLLDIVTSVRRDATPLVALAMARRKEFEGRMLAILDPELRRVAPSRKQSLGMSGTLALLAVTVGAAAPVPRAATDSVTRASVPTVMRDPTSESRRERTEVRTRDRSRDRSIDAIIGGMTKGRAQQAQSPDERATLLAKMLRTDTSATLRRVAAWGLGEYADEPVAVEALSSALRQDASPKVREMAAWALAEGDEGRSDAIDALITALKSDASQEVRATSAWALGNVGARSAVEALVSALGSSEARGRTRARWAIGSISPKQAPKPVLALLRDGDARVRRMAAWTLYQIEDPESVPALRAAVETEQNKDVQIGEIRALAALGEKSVEALRGLLESSDPKVKSMAVHALAGGQAAGPWPWPWPEPRPFP